MSENPYQSPKEPGADEAFFRSEDPRPRRRFVGLSTFLLGVLMVSVGDMLYAVPAVWRGRWWLGAVLMALGLGLVLWSIAMSVGLARVPFTRRYPARRKPLE